MEGNGPAKEYGGITSVKVLAFSAMAHFLTVADNSSITCKRGSFGNGYFGQVSGCWLRGDRSAVIASS